MPGEIPDGGLCELGGMLMIQSMYMGVASSLLTSNNLKARWKTSRDSTMVDSAGTEHVNITAINGEPEDDSSHRGRKLAQSRSRSVPYHKQQRWAWLSLLTTKAPAYGL